MQEATSTGTELWAGTTGDGDNNKQTRNYSMRIESDGDCVSDAPFQSSRIPRVAPLLDRSPQAWTDSFPIKLSQRGLLGDGDKHPIRAPRGKQQGS